MATVSLVASTAAGSALPPGSGPDGAPRPWERSMGVGPFSEVNLRTGHVLTTIPIVGWSGRGPSIQFNLYHNSSGEGDTATRPPKGGFPEPGEEVVWRTSYSGGLDFSWAPYITVIHDDGTEDLYTPDGGAYTAPPGVWNALSAGLPPGYGSGGYTLTDKHQNKRLYDSTGRLTHILDASGNALTLSYNTGDCLETITDASGRTLTLTCDTECGLLSVHDVGFDLDRTWTLERNFNGAFIALRDPMDFTIAFDYDGEGRIKSLTDKDDHEFKYLYASGRLYRATDPSLPAYREFTYQNLPDGRQTTYRDRRGGLWRYEYDSAGNLFKLTNPLSAEQTFGYDPGTSDPQAIHNVVSYTNALLHTWQYEYDDRGNLLAATDPLTHRTEWSYDPLNNLLTVTPPLDEDGNVNPDKRVTLVYGDLEHPTSVTEVQEPPAEVGGPVPVTTIDYYGTDEDIDPLPADAWNGLVEQVTDPNGVRTYFDYDEFGQPATEIENSGGGPETTTPNNVTTISEYDSGGRLKSSNHRIGVYDCTPPPAVGSVLVTDDNGNVTEVSCGIVMACPWPVSAGCNPPNPNGLFSAGCLGGPAAYTNMGLPESLDRCIEDPSTGEQGARYYDYAYDGLYRMTSQIITSEEATWDSGGQSVSRETYYDYDDSAGTSLVTGPDFETIYATLDPAGRLGSVTRSTTGGNITAVYTYDAADRLELIEYGNGTRTILDYDEADRLTGIRHETTGEVVDQFYEAWFYYTADGLVYAGGEYDAAGNVGWLSYSYDNRNRLTGEGRTGSTPYPYHFGYTYDLGGNRLTKTDSTTGRLTTYHYDITDENDGGQHNNRLLSYEVEDGGQTVERAWYDYGADGNVVRLIRWQDTAPDEARVYWFYYDTSDHLWLSVAGTGAFDEEAGSLSNCVADKAAEYRYDGGRERYLVRPRDPETLAVLPGAQWRDYESENIYGDNQIDPATGDVTQGTAYLPGVGLDDPAAADMPGYFGWDQIGTTRAISGTDEEGPPVLRESKFTAFGEVFTSSGSFETRYDYAGAWGYETAASFDPLEELGWLHVGHRYYDPALGRFVQRDPIGIRGDPNVYEYARSNPAHLVDPDGNVVIGAAIFGTLIAGGIDVLHSVGVIHDAGEVERFGMRTDVEHLYDVWRNSSDYKPHQKVHEITNQCSRVTYRYTVTAGRDGKQSYVLVDTRTGRSSQWYRDRKFE